MDRRTLAVPNERCPEEVRPVGSPGVLEGLVRALAGAGGGIQELRVLVEPGQVFAAGARGNVPMLQGVVTTSVLRPRSRAMDKAMSRAFF